MRSPQGDSPDSITQSQKEAFSFLRGKGQRRHNTTYLNEMKEAAALPRSQSGNTGEVKSCVEQLNKSFGPAQEARSDDGPKARAEERKKTFVERFLKKQNMTYADSPSTDSEEKSERLLSMDLTPPNRRTEANNISIEDPNYYSDPVKSDFDSEHSVDSKHTDETKPSEGSISSLTVPPIRMFESSGASDWVPQNGEQLSGSDSRSVKSSPLNVTKNFTSAYKKSQFYKNPVFTFAEGDRNDADTEDREEKKSKHEAEDENRQFVRKSEGALRAEEGDESHSKFFRHINKTHSVYISGENINRRETGTPLTNPIVNTKATEEMIKLRLDMSKKKEMIKVYEVITKKGKIIINKEPYQWSKHFNKKYVLIFSK